MKTCLVRVLACVLLACALTACPETTVNEDFGLKPVALEADDWNGLWMPVDDDDKIQFTVTDAAKGVLQMTEPDVKKNKPMDFRMRRASNDDKVKLCFILTRDEDGKEAKMQIQLLRLPEEGVLLAWMINDEAVETAIKAGQLKGTTQRVKDDPHNHLDSDPANYTKLLEPQFWDWSEPSILKRAKP
ncbi:hypothetical protein [Prosthecobacter sp.]|uniref:hypothetical protein n=1 Tax=Prosthecobacter sp. TaxID=1965333 RepID=UPI002ABC7060|nr:hypothetical protein [Prosthecobacter sp.]MDZ4404757.1 hypothetical protein [Prosthecobacter sp.]